MLLVVGLCVPMMHVHARDAHHSHEGHRALVHIHVPHAVLHAHDSHAAELGSSDEDDAAQYLDILTATTVSVPVLAVVQVARVNFELPEPVRQARRVVESRNHDPPPLENLAGRSPPA
jgi:hypothetical protein